MLVGVQTFTIRKLAQNDLKQALLILKEIDVSNIELARIDFSEENAIIVKNSLLNVVSLQVKFRKIKNHFSKYVQFCNIVSCKTLVVSVLPLSCIIGGKNAILRFSKQLNILSKRCQMVGITLAFHHHDFEFSHIDEKTKFEYLVENTDSNVKFISDTYWVKKSGIEPVTIIKWLDSRLLGLHLRDHIIINNHHQDTEIGNGDIDFKAVFDAAKPYALYGAIEQKSDHPVESLKKSIETLKALQLYKKN
jgi:hypothetical protein